MFILFVCENIHSLEHKVLKGFQYVDKPITFKKLLLKSQKILCLCIILAFDKDQINYLSYSKCLF